MKGFDFAPIMAALAVMVLVWFGQAGVFQAEARNPQCFASGATGEEIVCAYVDHTAGAIRTATASAGAPTLGRIADLGGIGVSGVSCVSWGERHDCYVTATDNTLYSIAYLGGGAYSPWLGLGAPTVGVASEPSCVAWAAGRIDCFVRGGDGALWQRAWNGSTWVEWRSLAGQYLGPPRCYARTVERIDCFIMRSTGRLAHVLWDGARWRTQAAPVGAGVRAPAACAVLTTPSLSCVFNVHGALVHKRWDGARWTDQVSPPRPDVPFHGAFDCTAGRDGQVMFCAVRTVLVGLDIVAGLTFRAGDSAWSPLTPLGIGTFDDISCAATALGRRPPIYLCAFTAAGGGGPVEYATWNGARDTRGSIEDILTSRLEGSAVGLDYERFR